MEPRILKILWVLFGLPLQNPPLKIVNEVGLYRNSKILKKDEIPMLDCCKIEIFLSKDVRKTYFFLYLTQNVLILKPSD